MKATINGHHFNLPRGHFRYWAIRNAKITSSSKGSRTPCITANTWAYGRHTANAEYGVVAKWPLPINILIFTRAKICLVALLLPRPFNDQDFWYPLIWIIQSPSLSRLVPKARLQLASNHTTSLSCGNGLMLHTKPQLKKFMDLGNVISSMQAIFVSLVCIESSWDDSCKFSESNPTLWLGTGLWSSYVYWRVELRFDGWPSSPLKYWPDAIHCANEFSQLRDSGTMSAFNF